MQTGSKMLKVVSIIMLVFCGLSVLGGLLLMGGMSLLGAAGGSAGVGAAVGAIFFIVMLLSVGLQLAAGILGVKNWNRPDKAQPSIVLGIIILVFAAISLFSSFSGGDASNIMSSIVGLVLPVLYVVAAFQLKKMGQAAPPSYGQGYPPAGQPPYPPQGPQNPPVG